MWGLFGRFAACLPCRLNDARWRTLRISTRGRYALRLMLDLARSGGVQCPISLRDVSRRQHISVKYLEQIVIPLGKAGLLRAMRGAGGGYLLTRSPDAYTVGDILRPVEGSLAPVECARDDEFCQYSKGCPTIKLWQEIYKAVSNVVDHTTLQDLMELGEGPAS